MVDLISQIEIENQYELYNRVKNDHRKQLLIFLYSQPRTYKELSTFSKLKPGSLYHHLGVLEPLIMKADHGLYEITELGKQIIQELGLVEEDELKPSVSIETASENHKLTMSKVTEESFSGKDETIQFENTSSDDLLSYIWLSNSSYLISGIILVTTSLLIFEGVALSGSAIYSVGGLSSLWYTILGFGLGIATMYVLEEIIYRYQVYNRIKFIITIRIISMLPSTIIGISLLLTFYSGAILPDVVYPIIFAISILCGTIVSASGIQYLRGDTKYNSFIYASIIGAQDLLLGFIILISQ